MNNKKIAAVITVFVILLFAIIALIGIAGHIPLISKPLMLILALILIAFILGFFIIIVKRGQGK